MFKDCIRSYYQRLENKDRPITCQLNQILSCRFPYYVTANKALFLYHWTCLKLKPDVLEKSKGHRRSHFNLNFLFWYILFMFFFVCQKTVHNVLALFIWWFVFYFCAENVTLKIFQHATCFSLLFSCFLFIISANFPLFNTKGYSISVNITQQNDVIRNMSIALT